MIWGPGRACGAAWGPVRRPGRRQGGWEPPTHPAPPAPPPQILTRLTDRRIAVEKELSALGEGKKGTNEIFRHCRGFERAYSVLLQVRSWRRVVGKGSYCTARSACPCAPSAQSAASPFSC